MTVNILSFGAGVNSAACLALLRLRHIKIDEVIMADTGNEEPETYEWLTKEAIPYFRQEGLQFTIVRAKEGSIYDHCIERKIFPFKTKRWCTDRFKIQPIRKFLKEKYADQLVNCFMGYDADEPQRAFDKPSRNGNIVYVYPLLFYGIGRQRCKQFAQAIDLHIPVRSRCFFCPFKGKRGFMELYKRHPELYAAARKLEENSTRFPRDNMLMKKHQSLREIQEEIEQQQVLQTPYILLEDKREPLTGQEEK